MAAAASATVAVSAMAAASAMAASSAMAAASAISGRMPAVGASGPLELLVIQPTPFCNIDCSYCYLPHRTDRRRMSSGTMRHVVQDVFASGLVAHELRIAWHAGEPLVLPPSYYTDAFDLFER